MTLAWVYASLVFVWLCLLAGAWLDAFRPTGRPRNVKIAAAVLVTALYAGAFWYIASTLVSLHLDFSRPITTHTTLLGLLTIVNMLIGLANLTFQWIRFVRARRDAGTTPAMHH